MDFRMMMDCEDFNNSNKVSFKSMNNKQLTSVTHPRESFLETIIQLKINNGLF